MRGVCFKPKRMKTIQYTVVLYLLLFVSSVQAQFFNILNQRLYGTTDGVDIRNIDTINANIVIGFSGGGGGCKQQ